MRRIVLLAALLAVSTAASADEIWTKFHSKAEGFAVEFPYTPTMQEPLPLVVGDVTVATRSFALDMDKTTYLVSVSDYSNKTMITNPPLFLDSLTRKQTEGTKVDSNAPIEVSGHPGREVKFTAGNGDWVHAYELFASGRLYQVVFRDSSKDRAAARRDSERFLNIVNDAKSRINS